MTGLRFWAALHVLLYHYVARGDAELPGGAAGRVLAGVNGSGYLGVSLFFVLSGFVLAYNYLEPDSVRRVPRRAFWIARLARVYPVYLVSLLVSAPVVWAWARHKLQIEPLSTAAGKIALVVSLNVTMLQAWLPHTVAPWNTPGWSLSVEAFFYALFPFVAPRFARVTARRPAAAVAGLWLAALVAPLTYVLLSADPQLNQSGPDAVGMTLTVVKYFPLFHLPEFLIGVTVGAAYLRRAEGGPEARARWGQYADAASLACVAVLVATPRLPYPLLHNGLVAPLFALLVFALAAGDGRVSRLLSTKRALLLGGASYALYLLHFPVLGYVASGAARLGGAPPSPRATAAVAAAVAIVLSVAVLSLFEEPARLWIRRSLNGEGTARPRDAERPPPTAAHRNADWVTDAGPTVAERPALSEGS